MTTTRLATPEYLDGRPSLPIDATDGQTVVYDAATDSWLAADPADGGGSGGAGPITGTGSPEGVVTADPGAEYVDTASTLGALVWRKFSGTGKTGWRVTVGDTGWRNILSAFAAGPNGAGGTYSLAIRRTADVVRLGLYRYGTLATVSATGFLPDGWRPRLPTVDTLFLAWAHGYDSANGQERQTIIRGDWSLTLPAAAGGDGLKAEVSWAADPAGAPWPATLPGTPA